MYVCCICVIIKFTEWIAIRLFSTLESLGSAIWLKHLSPSLMYKKHQFIFGLTLWKIQAIIPARTPLSTNYISLCAHAVAAFSCEWRRKKGITSWKSIKFSDYKMVLHNVHSFSLNVSRSICLLPLVRMSILDATAPPPTPSPHTHKTSKKFITTFVTVCVHNVFSAVLKWCAYK